jgi:methionine--tRNA ligase beta chain
VVTKHLSEFLRQAVVARTWLVLLGNPGLGIGAAMATISIDQFRTIDLRVATITAAVPHPNADRLVVLTVDLGSEQRQLVAGIRAHYEPQDLLGKQIVVVANLEPATLRGVESQGMLLAASDSEARLALVTPEKPVSPGAQVK